MKNYIQLHFTGLDKDQQEILIARLAEIGFEGFEEEEGSMMAFIPETTFDRAAVESVVSDMRVHFSEQTIVEQNWNAVWESAFDPVKVGEFAAVRASFHEPGAGVKHDIIITPKMSFGTGHHATTEMMIAQMEKIGFEGKTVFDFGTGTGVLAILAEKCGAASILAIDNDPWSIANAKENLTVNNCSKVFIEKSERPPSGKRFDIILANINKNVILENMRLLVEGLSQGGTILLSGLLAEDEKDLVSTASTFGLHPIDRLEKKSWICMQFEQLDRTNFTLPIIDIID